MKKQFVFYRSANFTLIQAARTKVFYLQESLDSTVEGRPTRIARLRLEQDRRPTRITFMWLERRIIYQHESFVCGWNEKMLLPTRNTQVWLERRKS